MRNKTKNKPPDTNLHFTLPRLASAPLLYPEVVIDRAIQARKQLSAKKWDQLHTMFEDYAIEAIAIARSDYHEDLAGTPDSVHRLERILNRLCPAPDPLPPEEAEWLTLLWGSYLGELLRYLHGGAWTMSIYPGSEMAVPTLEIDGSRLYPMLKVSRRLTLGASESIPAFYAMLLPRLNAARRLLD